MSRPEPAERAARAGLRLPRALTVAITGACNLRCRHCWVESGTSTSAGHVPVAAALRLVDGFAALGVDAVWITGGEPLAHPGWERLLEQCCARPSLRVVGVQTNAGLLDQRRVAALRALPIDRLALQVSLDGASPATHDQVRGAGSFGAALAGVTRLAAAGLGGRTAIAFTEMRHNMEDLPALLELVERLHLRGVVAGTLVRGGRAARSGLEPPTPAQYRALLARYHADARFRERYDRLGRCPAVEWWRGRAGAGGDPCALFDHPYVGADGRLAPCRLCQADEFAVAGAFDRPLHRTLDEAIPRWQRLLRLARWRAARLPACRGCPAQRPCASGCIGRALASCGSAAATEDRCELRRAVQLWEADGEGEPPSAGLADRAPLAPTRPPSSA